MDQCWWDISENQALRRVTHARVLHEFSDIALQMGSLVILEGSLKHFRVQELICNFAFTQERDRKVSWSETPPEGARQLSYRVLTRHMLPGNLVVYGIKSFKISRDNVDPDQRIFLFCDARYQPRAKFRDSRNFGSDPGIITARGYGELIGAIPRNEAWRI